MIIEKASERIVNYLVTNKMIEDTEDYRSFYRYGVEITISSVFNIVLLLFIGIVSGHFLDTVIYLPLFILLRRFTGGYHADTYFKCNLIGCFTFVCVLFIRDYSLGFPEICSYVIIAGVISIIAICVQCPIENANKPISDDKKPIYKLIAVFIGVLYLGLGSLLMTISKKYGLMILYTLLTVTVFIINVKKERRDI